MKKRFFEKTWFIILMLIFLPPVGVILMWIGKKKWNKILKIVITVILALWTFLFVVALASMSDSEPSSGKENVTTEKTVVEETTAFNKENIPSIESATTEKVTEITVEKESTIKEEIASSEETNSEAVATTKKTTTTKKVTTTQKSTTTKKPTTSKKATTTQKSTTTKKPTTTKKITTTQKPTTTKKPTTTQKPTTTKKPTTTANSGGQIVYRTKSGECYHYENPCGSGNYYAVTLNEATNAGLRACEKCVLH